jgi:hypothetical protein
MSFVEAEGQASGKWPSIMADRMTEFRDMAEDSARDRVRRREGGKTRARTEWLFVVVDVLDEFQLSDKNRSRLISALLDFHSAKGTKANLMVTSRPGIPDIIATFDKYPKLNILADTKDIEQYLRGHMDDLARSVAKRRDLREKIVNDITEAADGMEAACIVPYD